MTNNALWAHNLAALRQYHPHLSTCIDTHITTVPAQKPIPATDSTSMASTITSQLTNPAILIWNGVSRADVLLAYAKKPHPLQKVIIVIEPSLDIFAGQLATCDMSQLFAHPHILWNIANNDTATQLFFRAALDAPDISPLTHCIQIYTEPHLNDARKDYFDNCNRILDDCIYDLNAYMNTEPIDAYHGLLNILDNLTNFSQLKSVDNLKGAMTGMPGVLISSGPSLTQRIPLLNELQHRAVMFACDSALSVIWSHGIKPHFVGTTERREHITRFFEGIAPLEDVYLVTNPFTPPQTYDAYPGPILTMIRDLAIMRWFFPNNHRFYPGACVAHQGLLLLHYLGCNPIIVVGQDLCFDQDSGYTHVEGMRIRHHRNRHNFKDREIWLPGNDGTPKQSYYPWKHFSNVFTHIIHKYKINCLNVIEKHQGIHIEGMTQLNPNELTLPPIQPTILQHLNTQYQTLSPTFISPNIISDTEQALSHYFNDCFSTLNACMEKYPSIISCESPDRLHAISRELSQFEDSAQKLQNDTAHVYKSLLDHFTQKTLFDISRESYVLLGKTTSQKEKLLRKMDLIHHWFSTCIYWCKQIQYSIQNKK